MVTTGVNADGYREVLGVATSTAESGTGWNTFFTDPVARGLNGVALVTSDAHTGLVAAIEANLPDPLCRPPDYADVVPEYPMSLAANGSTWLRSA